MRVQINNDLTDANCASAIDLSTQLFNSAYTNNDVRMLYASAHGCNTGIILFSLLDQLTNADLTSLSSIFRTMVKLFPSKAATDSRMESAGYAVDALQSILVPGAVVSTISQVNWTTHNPGSILTKDHTGDANTYLFFISMAFHGTSLNRYGYAAGTSPATLNFAKENALPWTTQAAILADSTYAGCGVASSLLNMFDSIHAISGLMTGNLASALGKVETIMESAITLAGTTQCKIDFVSNAAAAQICADAGNRLRYHQSCQESPQIASFAAGIIQAINAGWN